MQNLYSKNWGGAEEIAANSSITDPVNFLT